MTVCIECGEHPPIKNRRICRRCKALAEDKRRQLMSGREPGECSVVGCTELRVVWPSQISAYCRDHHARKQRESNIRYEYGITVEEYDGWIARANGRCWICDRSRKLVLDHDHATGAIRGVLCDSCNTGLGRLGDDLDTLRRAVSYLETGRPTMVVTRAVHPAKD